MKNKVACCYLTHEHPEVVDEVLGAVCEEYGKRGIDIYVYDSSENDDTKGIVEKYSSKGSCGVYYVPIQFTKGKNGGNEKDIEKSFIDTIGDMSIQEAENILFG